MSYALGGSSKQKLIGVHPLLRSVVLKAIELTTQDFTVYEGPRTLERQKKLVAAGASQTLDSMHIPASDRLHGNAGIVSHAVDLVPWIDGEPRWEWGPCYNIALAVDAAATALGVADKMCWGAVWDRWMSQYGGDMKQAVADYQARTIARKKAAGKKPTVFLDGPHYQICRLG